MRALDAGESFIVTRNGVPVGELRPVQRRRYVNAEIAHQIFAALPPVDFDRFREDIDSFVDQNPDPRV